MTHTHKGEGDVNRTNTAGTGFEATFHGLVHCVENFLGLLGNVQCNFAHDDYLPLRYKQGVLYFLLSM